MPGDRAAQAKRCRARIARLEKLRAGFSREAMLVLRGQLPCPVDRESYLAALNRVLLSLSDAGQVLATALSHMGEPGK
jgi:hypothetical protein